MQSGGFLGKLLEPFLRNDLPFLKYILKPLAKSVLIPLGLTAAAATYEAIQKKIFGLGMYPSDLAKQAKSIISWIIT